MAKTLEQLLSLSSIIANETKAGANTALRVGGLFSDIIYYLRDLDYADKDDIPSLEGYATEQWVLGKGYATTSDLDNRIDTLVNGAPAAYDTLKEIADVLAGNVNSISDILTALGNKADKATTLSGYGITDAYTISQIDSIVNGLSGNISTLQGYFTDGVANSALRLSDNGSYTAWGKTFFTNGKPKSLSGALTDVTDITSSGTITTNKIVIGNGTIEWDEANKGFKVTGLYSTTYLSAKGANTNGGSTPSGGQYTRLDTWDGYTSAMDGWVLSAKLGKGLYDTQNSLISRVGALEGKATNVSFTQSLTSGTQIGTITIDGASKNIYAPTIPTSDINKGVTAYGWGNHASVGYLLKSGGTITGNLTMGSSDNNKWIPIEFNRGGYKGFIGVGANQLELGSLDGYIRISPTDLTYLTNNSVKTIIHSGNYTDYTYSKSTIDGKFSGLGTFAYKSSLAFADLTDKPTTIGGYGITDAITTANISSQSVASADKLTTARSVWGQSFDGTGNVDGNLHMKTADGGIIIEDTNSNSYVTTNGYIKFNNNYATVASIVLGNDILNISAPTIALNPSNSLLIGTTTDSGYKLDVDGVVRAKGFKSQSLSIECYDNNHSGYGWEINNYGNPLYIQGGSSGNLVLCSGGGNVGIGTTSPQYKLDVSGTLNASIYYASTADSSGINTSGHFRFGKFDEVGGLKLQFGAESGTKFEILNSAWSKALFSVDTAGNVIASGTIRSYIGIFSDGYVSAKGQNTSSDMRLKNVLNDVVLDVKDIANAPSIRFAWKKGGGIDVGSSAQYWQGLLPDAVKEQNSLLEMQYGNIALLSAIAIAKKVETHEERIAILEKENKELRNEIKYLRFK